MKSEVGSRKANPPSPPFDKGGRGGINRPLHVTPHTKFWIGIGILILLAPIGLILPEVFRSSGSWGEWGVDKIKNVAGYIPEGMKKLSQKWSAPISDYAFHGWDKGVKGYIAYIVSGLLGVIIVAGLTYLFAKIIKKDKGE